MLFAAFVGAERCERLTPANLDAAQARVDAWHREVVRPLRSVRKRLKTGPPPAPKDSTARLRRRIQQVEIESELIELDELGDLIGGWEATPASGDSVESATAAIKHVIQTSSKNPTDYRDEQAIETIAAVASTLVNPRFESSIQQPR